MFLGYMGKICLLNITKLLKKDIMKMKKFNNNNIENFERGHFFLKIGFVFI